MSAVQMITPTPTLPPASPARIVREYGPALIPGADTIHGVSFDGRRIWAATGEALLAVDPSSGAVVHRLDRPCDAGTAFDGRYLWQISEGRIDKLDPDSGTVLASIPAPGQGDDSGLAWADGSLWVGQFKSRHILRVDPDSGAVLRRIDADRFVTGVTWLGSALWHGTWENGESELRRIDPDSGEVLQRCSMPPDTGVSGLESDGQALLYCGGGGSGKVRAVQLPGPTPTVGR